MQADDDQRIDICPIQRAAHTFGPAEFSESREMSEMSFGVRHV